MGMTQPGIDRSKQALDDIEIVPSMTFWEKVSFLWWPTYSTLIAAPLLLILAYGLALVTIGLFFHPHSFKQGVSSLLFIVAGCVVFGALLVYPLRFFRKLRIRKRRSGSHFPSGGELVGLRLRKKHPSAWVRICTLSCFYLIAIGVTYKTFETADLHSFRIWVPASLFWSIAFVATVEAFRPRPERLWTGVLGSGAFCCLAVVAAVSIIRSGDTKSIAWLWPLIFAYCSGYLAVATFRGFGKRVRSIPES
jgi:predicted membrane channel-forming protein YqfA (hemolysin III family)